MSKKSISDNPDILEYLLNDKISISERLEKYNKYDCLAFITSPRMLYPYFNQLFNANTKYQDAFKVAKTRSIQAVKDKQSQSDYETFVKYLFYDLGVTKNSCTDPIQNIIIYDITPKNEEQAKILEKVSIEFTKNKLRTVIRKPKRYKNTDILTIDFVLFETLKSAFEKSLAQPFAVKEEVIEEYRREFLEPFKDAGTTGVAQTIYKDFRIGKTEDFKGKDYSYYFVKGAVLELMKFEEYLNQINIKSNSTPNDLDKEITPILKTLPPSKANFTFINNFDQVEPNKVYEYFFNSLVKTKYIDESTLKSYLISAFQDMKEPQQKITINNKSTNKKVQEIFYNYYKDIAGKPYGKQQSYIELLGNYFVGFDTKKLKTNFSKTY